MDDGEKTVAISREKHADDVQWGFIIGPFLVSLVLVAVILTYRCWAHRLRRERIDREREQELQELKGAEGLEAGRGGGSASHGGVAKTGLGNDYYMSAYKKLEQQA